ncbi:MAG: Membrane-bound lytic murein transglycosylase precursor [Pseudomonadota bacterium]|jgi:membrane-bound lytic murein transglycosylase B
MSALLTHGRLAALAVAAAFAGCLPPATASANEAVSKPSAPKPSAARPSASKAGAGADAKPVESRSASRSRAAAAPDFGDRADVREFVRTMVERHGFDEIALTTLFTRTRSSELAVKLMQPAPPGFRRSWIAYRSRFVEPIRIREGLRFWMANADTVRRASQEYGVPEEIIVSIIGVETIYGRNTGDFRVIDALATLSFDYPRRAAYFREELEQYLLLAREGGFDPLDWRGSFAGAVGLPQFMPGSIRRHAVDFDGDGRIDLRTSVADAIGSVARFLANHGWERGGPTHFAATVEDERRARSAIDGGSPPAMTPLALAELGVTSPQEIPADRRLYLVDLPNGDDSTHYVLGAQNFWVVTRYNRSFFYAMAVIDLARALREQQPQAQARN